MKHDRNVKNNEDRARMDALARHRQHCIERHSEKRSYRNLHKMRKATFDALRAEFPK